MSENLYKTTGEFTPDKLIADNAIAVTAKGITIASGEGVLKRGTLLGKAADGTYKKTFTTESVGEGEDATDSTIGADCILADDVNAAEAEVITTAYITGAFNKAAIIVPSGSSVETHETELRKLGIFLKNVQEY